MDDNKTKGTVAFGFTKSTEIKKYIASSAFKETQSESKNDNSVTFIEAGKIDGKRNVTEESKAELVIPLIPNKQIFIPKSEDKDEDVPEDPSSENASGVTKNGSLTLEEQAKRELLLGSEKSQEDIQDEEEIKKQKNLLIPVGSRKDEILDVADQPDKPTDEEYEEVPVTAYGQAMLRGMGWAHGQGIGSRNKGVIKPLDISFRPKGMGLGAVPKKVEVSKDKKSDKSEEVLEIAKGKYVLVLSGTSKGFYGQVESIDGNTARVFVKLPLQNTTVSLSENVLQPVSTEEYKKSFRVLNKDKYDEHKARQDRELQNKEERKSKKERRRSRSDSRDRKQSRSRSRENKRRRRSRSRSKEKSSSYEKKKKALWVRPLLKVRCVDEEYKRGAFFKKKLIIIDVVSYDIVVCKTEEGKLVEDIHPSKLESVIPKESPAFVMIVRGKHTGKVGEIRARDKRSCMATVQILPDREKILELSYDDICEYIGDID